ncbi:sulfotransferase [Rubrobacter marinus]|uniref:sulfotransferase n=1 Tax=Rubrobacter marinus TaxID=2653852 RepID=UPI00140CB97A|nr:sulfotransferase [Rubrobacter marinus]
MSFVQTSEHAKWVFESVTRGAEGRNLGLGIDVDPGNTASTLTRERIKVLYIAGWGRSGSTILDNLLGQLEGFFSVGEINCLWERNLLGDWLCGCGRSFRACPVWSEVMKSAFGGVQNIDARKMIRLRDSGARTRHVPLMLTSLAEPLLKNRLSEYVSNLDRLYRGVKSVTGSRVIVDSSKSPAYSYALNMVPGVDLYVVHLVRDPRAVAYSWQRRKKVDPKMDGLMVRYGPFRSSVIWSAWNVVTEAFWSRRSSRYLRIRYEDLVADPLKTLRRIPGLVGEDAKLPDVEGRTVELKVTHTTSGNLSRFKTGTVELRPDEEWRASMKVSDKKLVGALTWPLRRRYGYLDRPS